MKIKCDREKLLSAFQTAASVVPSRSPKPILQNVRLDAGEDGAFLMATDMEMGIRVAVDGVTSEVPGSALLSVAQFGSILRESNAEALNIEADGQGVVVSGDNFSFKLASGKKYDFDTSMLSIPGYLIHQRIDEAREMVVGDLGFDVPVEEEPTAATLA